MPHVNNKFTEDYLDKGPELLRECLRDLRRVADRPSATAVRERCKNRMSQAMTIYRELREEYDNGCAHIDQLLEEILRLEDFEARFELVFKHMEDVRRGIRDIDEVIEFANDLRFGEKQVATT